MISPQNPLVFVILDGWGHDTKDISNPIKRAVTPAFDMFAKNYPRILLQASGLGVGMSWGEAGNSEVGHMNLGAGRVVKQYRSRIQKSIERKNFFLNETIKATFEHAQKNKTTVHLIGLLTSGTVHADFGHISALLEFGRQFAGVPIRLHLFLDGKDSGLHEAVEGLKSMDAEIKKYQAGSIATVIGRYYGMDRDNNWDRTQQAYNLITFGQGTQTTTFNESIQQQYSPEITDTNMPGFVASDYQGLAKNDALFFFNFREDSMRQIFRSFTENKIDNFDTGDRPKLFAASMTEYLEKQKQPFAFEPPEITNSLSEVLSANGKKQFHIAETQKYAHVTYFLNGLKNEPFKNEENALIESPKDVHTEPRLRAIEIAQRIEQEIDKQQYDVFIVNIANADVIAHTGDFNNAITAIEAADQALTIIYNKITAVNGAMIITADHGNAESMIYAQTGQPESKHSQNPVPFLLIGPQFVLQKDQQQIYHEIQDVSGILGDVAPTILHIMGIPQPPEMTGTSLWPTLQKLYSGQS